MLRGKTGKTFLVQFARPNGATWQCYSVELLVSRTILVSSRGVKKTLTKNHDYSRLFSLEQRRLKTFDSHRLSSFSSIRCYLMITFTLRPNHALLLVMGDRVFFNATNIPSLTDNPTAFFVSWLQFLLRLDIFMLNRMTIIRLLGSVEAASPGESHWNKNSQ